MTSSTVVSPPRLREASFADYKQIYRLESVFFPDSLPEDDRRGLFVDNPLWSRVESAWPIGWVLEDSAGQIVGSVNNIPSLYHIDGAEKICANGHCWVVQKEYRGYATMLMDEYFNQEHVDLVLSAKVGSDAAPIWNTYANRVPLGDWGNAAFVVTRYRGFARQALQIKGIPFAGALAAPAALTLKLKDAVTMKSLPAAPTSVEIREVDDFDSRFDSFWDELLAQSPDKLLAVRDRETLRWHFAISMRKKRLWIVTATRNKLLRAYCVLKLHTRPNGARSVKLVDYQTVEHEVDLLPGLLRLALKRCAAEDCQFLEHHGCGLPKMQGFDSYAPYRATKPSWSFFYHTDDPTLNAQLQAPEAWDPSEYDGDSSYK